MYIGKCKFATQKQRPHSVPQKPNLKRTVSPGLRESRTQEGAHRFYRFRTPLRVFFLSFFLLRFLCVFFIEKVVSVALGGGARTVSINKIWKNPVAFLLLTVSLSPRCTVVVAVVVVVGVVVGVVLVVVVVVVVVVAK